MSNGRRNRKSKRRLCKENCLIRNQFGKRAPSRSNLPKPPPLAVVVYSDAQRYDLVMGAYSSGSLLNFYRRQIALYGEPVSELACGSARLTIPLANEGVNITGLDMSEQMLNLAKLKASTSGVSIRFIQGDIRSFDLGEKFKFIFIPAQSLSHLHGREELEDCFACVRRHLADKGRLLIELFDSSVRMPAHETGHRYHVGQYVTVKNLHM